MDPREIPFEELRPRRARPGPRRAAAPARRRSASSWATCPATRRWERADQDLLELFAIEVSAAIRNAQLYARVEAQNRRLVELDEAKDDFLRGVSHNLQTPLAQHPRLRAAAGRREQPGPAPRDHHRAGRPPLADGPPAADREPHRVGRPAAARRRSSPRRRASGRRGRRWARPRSRSRLEDASEGWLALADPDQLDQVLWAILDNAVHYGDRTPSRTSWRWTRRPDLLRHDRRPRPGRPRRGPRAALPPLRAWRGRPTGEGTGLGLYVSRALCRAMDGDLVLEPAEPGRGAAFTIGLPGRGPRRVLTVPPRGRPQGHGAVVRAGNGSPAHRVPRCRHKRAGSSM